MATDLLASHIQLRTPCIGSSYHDPVKLLSLALAGVRTDRWWRKRAASTDNPGPSLGLRVMFTAIAKQLAHWAAVGKGHRASRTD
jgi:hypothetical protein